VVAVGDALAPTSEAPPNAMCGIAGILGPADSPPPLPELEALAAALEHRGPDQRGTAVRGPAGLVAARLAIVDLSEAGAQPMADDRGVLAYNGEIYNHSELRRELEREGAELVGHSDTEVLHHLLARHGVEATLPRLRGMFAFAWWDGTELWLARDRFGIKPLVWTQTGGRLVFASEARALAAVAALEVDATQALFGFLSLADRSGRRTVFRGVQQVPPGHVLRATAPDRVRVEGWWDLADEVDPDLYAELSGQSHAELALRLDQLLERSVARMLMGDAPTGTFVSGGVDSAVLAALVGDHSGDHALLAADVVGPRSEAAAAAAVARSVGRPLRTTPYAPDDVLGEWAPATLAYEAPLVTHMNSLPYGALARLARAEGVKSVLTGEGADELFYGYTETAFEPVRRVLRAPVAAVQRLYGVVPGLVKRVLPELSDPRERELADITEDFERRRAHESSLAAYAFAGRQAPRLAAGLAMLSGHLLSLLHRNDRMGMAASVESRFPYLDEDVVRFALNLPLSAKLRWGTARHDRKHPFLRDKAVLRDVAVRHLPTTIADRPKDGFPTIGHEQLRVGSGLFEDSWLSATLGWTGDGIRRLCEDEPPVVAGRLASVEVFARLYARGESPEAITDDLRRHVRIAR
jgi:asparagine synthase (glutamine-hydrolysing)